MIDVVRENIRSYGEAGQVVPGRPHASTFARRATRGRSGVRLETVVIGGRRYTSLEALERFCRRLSGETNDANDAAKESSASRGRYHESVDRQPDAEGS
jgi:hypothetical protein